MKNGLKTEAPFSEEDYNFMGITEIIMIGNFALNLFKTVEQSSLYQQPPQQCVQVVEMTYPEKTKEQRTKEQIMLDNYLKKATYESDKWMTKYLSNLPQ
jgi:hypothetical protein